MGPKGLVPRPVAPRRKLCNFNLAVRTKEVIDLAAKRLNMPGCRIVEELVLANEAQLLGTGEREESTPAPERTIELDEAG